MVQELSKTQRKKEFVYTLQLVVFRCFVPMTWKLAYHFIIYYFSSYSFSADETFLCFSALQVLALVLSHDSDRHLFVLLVLYRCSKTESSLQSFTEAACPTKNGKCYFIHICSLPVNRNLIWWSYAVSPVYTLLMCFCLLQPF